MIEITAGVSTYNSIPLTIKGARTYSSLVYVSSDTTNCKLSYIHGAGTLAGVAADKLKPTFDAILKYGKGCVILNTTQKQVFDFITTTYPIYYQHAVPIGYNNSFQYHVCFKNTINVNGNCRDPKDPAVLLPAVKLDLDKAFIQQKLEAVLKAKRRKMDYVVDFIKSL